MSARPKPIHVLHVDDEPGLADLASTLIERDNEAMLVQTETDPRACQKQLEDDSVSVDCIVSDYDMPHLDGLELLERVREMNPTLPFILFTGKGSEEIAAEAISKGVNDYMQKEPGTEHYKVLANRIEHHVQQVRTEQALENSEAKYRALVDQNIVGIYLMTGTEFRYVNPRLAEIFGYRQDELIDSPPTEVVAEQDEHLVAENIQRRLDGAVDTVKYTFTGRRKDGTEVTVLAQGRGIRVNGKPAIAGVLLDVDDIDPID